MGLGEGEGRPFGFVLFVQPTGQKQGEEEQAGEAGVHPWLRPSDTAPDGGEAPGSWVTPGVATGSGKIKKGRVVGGGGVGGAGKKAHGSTEAATKLTDTEKRGQAPRWAQPPPVAAGRPRFQKLARAGLQVHEYQLS